MNRKFVVILMIISIFSTVAVGFADSYSEEEFDDYDDYDDIVQIGQYDIQDAVLGDVSTYPKNFTTYSVDSYGFRITPKSLRTVVYDGKPVTYNITAYDEESNALLKEDEDYTIDYVDNDAPGTAYMIIEGMGKYEGFIIYPFKIERRSGVGSAVSEYDDLDYTPDPTRKPRVIFTPYPKLIQTTRPSTPKPSYPPAVTRSPTPRPTKSATPAPKSTIKPTKAPQRMPYMNIFDHHRFMWEYSAGEFGVDMYVSKAELAVIFSGILMDEYDAEEEYAVTYDDITENNPFRNYIGFISQYNIIKEKSDEEFEPARLITRADFAAVLASLTDKKGYSDFIDVPRDYWAKEYIDTVYSEGWMTGTSDGLFNPDKYITRGEIAKILVTTLGRDADETLKASNLPHFSDVPSSHWAYPYVMDAAVER